MAGFTKAQMKDIPQAKSDNTNVTASSIKALPNVKSNASFEPFVPSVMEADLMEDIVALHNSPRFVFDQHGVLSWVTQMELPDKEGSADQIISEYFSEMASNFKVAELSARLRLQSSTVQETKQIHRYQQFYKGIPVYSGQWLVHDYHESKDISNGKLYLPDLTNVNPEIDRDEALNIINEELRTRTSTHLNPVHKELFNIPDPVTQLVVLPICETTGCDYYLAYHLVVHPNLMERYEGFLDAHTGELIDLFTSSCQLHNACSHEGHSHQVMADQPSVEEFTGNENISYSMPPENGTGRDLSGQNRNFSVWREGSTFYLMDASRAMFSSSRSNMPNEPVGVIWTIDAFNTSPSGSNFRYDHIKSNSSNFNHANGVSAHVNGGLAYDYFLNTFGRNSINGSGGNIISLVNVADDDGGGLDNAFWNGQAMFYGNGRNAFHELARSEDVAAHEMSHGVIQNTANLEYRNESGALNESFADIFGAMVDRDDWKLGEDVVRTSAFPSGALRDMADPHNGGSRLGDPGWQPRHYNERFTGSQDNGGVHINSGITNHAYYLFAEEIGKSKAEQVYYTVLKDYLTRSSQFKDLRIAVETECEKRFGAGSTELAAARSAFDAVGIAGGGSGGNYQNDIEVNPGDDLISLTANNRSEIVVVNTDVNLIFDPLTSVDPLSRPSITDDGETAIYVSQDGHIQAVYMDWNNIDQDQEVLSELPEWRNAIIAKDGSRIAGLTDENDNIIHVFDFTGPNIQYKAFELYNPTYTQGEITGDVLFADAMEFDFNGEYIVYDAKNRIPNPNGQPIEYWDVGFIQVWDNQRNDFADGEVDKLFASLPENTSIGNPSFSKNSPYILAFDQIVEDFIGAEYYVRAANLETNDLSVIFQQGRLGWPNYSRDDRYVLFEAESNSGGDVIAFVEMQSDKIQAKTNPGVFASNAIRPVWFSNGERVLTSTMHASSELLGLYPNPVHQSVGFDWDFENSSDPVNWEVVDLFGKVLESGQLSPGVKEISLAFLTPGNYVLRVRQGPKQGFAKLVKLP